MDVELALAAAEDAESLYDIQTRAFRPLYEKYKDTQTNPANESLGRMRERIANPHGVFYKIMAEGCLAGGICVLWSEERKRCRISPMFIDPAFQGQGIGQLAIALAFDQFPQAIVWELSTIKEEKRNCHLYEKMGFQCTGMQRQMNKRATLVAYEKKI
ncbi:GNAT family N-acetyltransferase [Paenibacillus sp. NPDC058071]|uniref:GNAT family N-acetyltransferase n=1 Tax=Paenibacillus sp. NPDC058071 TaxID=3346326 RepID=UPI0036DA2E82